MAEAERDKRRDSTMTMVFYIGRWRRELLYKYAETMEACMAAWEADSGDKKTKAEN